MIPLRTTLFLAVAVLGSQAAKLPRSPSFLVPTPAGYEDSIEDDSSFSGSSNSLSHGVLEASYGVPDTSYGTPAVSYGAPAVECPAVTVTRTQQEYQTRFVPSTVYSKVFLTRTNVRTEVVTVPRVVEVTRTEYNTVHNTRFVTNTVHNTKVEQRINTVTHPAQVVNAYRTLTRITTSTIFNTQTQYKSVVVPQTRVQTQVRQIVSTRLHNRVDTRVVYNTIPGRTHYQTKFVTRTQVVTRHLPAQTLYVTRTNYRTVVHTQFSTLPAQRVYTTRTQYNTRVQTQINTRFVTVTRTHVNTRQQYVTRTNVAYSTAVQHQTQVNTQTRVQTRQQYRTVQKIVNSEVVRTNVQTQYRDNVQTQYVTITDRAVSTVSIPGVTSTVYRTHTQYNEQVQTQQNIIPGRTVVVTQTVEAQCGKTGYY